jgi:hypothetical protein
MQKISSRDAAALLKQAGATIRGLVAENQQLTEKLAQQERDTRVVKIARDMEAKGLSQELTLAEKVAHLRKAENLDVTEEAIKLAAPQTAGFGGLSEVPGTGGKHPFETFIESGEDTSAE